MRLILSVLMFLGLLHGTVAAAQTSPVVIELYTSQGCSSCPPADALLHDLAKRDDVIALSLHVDYWDYLGWEDAFADPAYTQRQHAYARAAGKTTVYTPQMIIGGMDHVVGSRPMQVMDFVQSHSAAPAVVRVTMTRTGDRVRIEAQSDVTSPFVVHLVRYTPEETVTIRRGENAGRVISYANTVNHWEEIDQWNGRRPLVLNARAPGDDPVVVIIQHAGHGPIVAAAQLR